MIIGTCSRCGGAVSTPDVWGGVNPPTPACTQCGAVAAKHGPVIPMQEPPRRHEPSKIFGGCSVCFGTGYSVVGTPCSFGCKSGKEEK